ncbi:DUF1189 family protein [Legionella dresdenensis]|uniref:DUF1189 family protein n=1 Tax=Legionella dresdenensis TaxID=450200 RepID=A0ABV8CC60_9GAMM
MARKNTVLTDIDTPHYGYLQAIIMSFFSQRLYVDVGKRWRGLAIIYLLLLMFIVAIPLSIRIAHDFNTFFDQQIIQPLQKMPTFYVQNGEVSFDKPMPYLVKNDQGQVVAAIDTTGSINAMSNQYPQMTTLITKNKFIFRLPSPNFFFTKKITDSSHSAIYVQELSPATNEVFNGSKWVANNGFSRLKLVSVAIIYPMIAMMFFVIHLILSLVFAMMAQLIAMLFFKFKITYKQACRLLIVSSTPHAFALQIVLTWMILFTGIGFLLTALVAVYLCYAIISLKRASNKLVFK